jgi:hypothetical protein
MSNLNILTTPVEIQTTSTITSFNVEIISVVIFTSAVIRVVQYDIDLNIVKVDNLTISGNDYANWINDVYLIDWVKTQLNFN